MRETEEEEKDRRGREKEGVRMTERGKAKGTGKRNMEG